MPFNIGPMELIVVLIIALIVVGPGKLPDVGSALGKSIREFRKAASDVKETTSLEPAKGSDTPAAAPAAPAAAPEPAAAPVPAPVPPALAAAPSPAVAEPAAPAAGGTPQAESPEELVPAGDAAEKVADETAAPSA